MAPEQIRGERVDARTDLFALGVVLYELASGRRPFEGRTIADVSSAILRDSPPPLTSLRADLPGDLVRIVERCLEKNPRQRIQTALDVANELRGLRRRLERGATVALGSDRDKIASIAVLPFVNRSASADDEYFSDGLADELLNVLAKIDGLRVSARASSFHFKGKDISLAAVGKALNVETLLDGSVRKAGDRVRISVQLVQVSNGYQLWSETYDRTLEDIFAVQDDIAQAVVKELRATFLGEADDSQAGEELKAELARAVRGRSTDPEAHRLYLQARHLIGRRSRDDTSKGIGYLKEALE